MFKYLLFLLQSILKTLPLSLFPLSLCYLSLSLPISLRRMFVPTYSIQETMKMLLYCTRNIEKKKGGPQTSLQGQKTKNLNFIIYAFLVVSTSIIAKLSLYKAWGSFINNGVKIYHDSFCKIIQTFEYAIFKMNNLISSYTNTIQFEISIQY